MVHGDPGGIELHAATVSLPVPSVIRLSTYVRVPYRAQVPLTRAGLKVGDDVSLIAHDDVLPLLKPEHFNVPLTTTQSSLRAAGARIAERLITHVLNPADALEREVWQAELILRDSTKPAPRR